MINHPFLTDQHHQVREMVRDFAETAVRPVARQQDIECRFPWENVKKMADLGFLGAPWPEDLGGSGMDTLSYIILIEELARVDASTSITVSAHTTLGTSPIVRFGTDEQKRTAEARNERGILRNIAVKWGRCIELRFARQQQSEASSHAKTSDSNSLNPGLRSQVRCRGL